jgi:hypothetical protein
MVVPRFERDCTRMKLESVLRAAQILRSQPGGTMPLRSLHARLHHEFGAESGSYAQMYHLLKNLPHSFIVMDESQLIAGSDKWPAQLREEYACALEGAGLGSCVRVALAEVAPEELHGGALGLANQTLSELWAAAAGDPVLREYLSTIAHQLDELNAVLADGAAAPPTTLPRGPQK